MKILKRFLKLLQDKEIIQRYIIHFRITFQYQKILKVYHMNCTDTSSSVCHLTTPGDSPMAFIQHRKRSPLLVLAI